MDNTECVMRCESMERGSGNYNGMVIMVIINLMVITISKLRSKVLKSNLSSVPVAFFGPSVPGSRWAEGGDRSVIHKCRLAFVVQF